MTQLLTLRVVGGPGGEFGFNTLEDQTPSSLDPESRSTDHPPERGERPRGDPDCSQPPKERPREKSCRIRDGCRLTESDQRRPTPEVSSAGLRGVGEPPFRGVPEVTVQGGRGDVGVTSVRSV